MSLYEKLYQTLNEAEGDEDSGNAPDQTEEDPPVDEDTGTDFDFQDDDDDPSQDDDPIDDNNEDDPEEPGDPDIDADEGDDTSSGDDLFDGDPTGDDDTEGDIGDDSTSTEEPVSTDEAQEEIIQPKILNISKLDRSLLKSALFGNYKELVMMVKRLSVVSNDKQYLFDQKDKDYIFSMSRDILQGLELYMSTKYYADTYEINLLNFTEFSKKIDDLIAFIDSLYKHKNND